METFLKWIDVLAKTAIAMAAAWASYQFSSLKQQNDDIQLIVDLMYSDNELKSMTGVQMLDAYQREGRIPARLYGVFVTTAGATSKSDAIRQAAQTSAAAAVQTDTAVAAQVQRTVNNLPARIYVHISHQEDRDRAQAVANELQNEVLNPSKGSESDATAPLKINVPGIEFIDTQIAQTQVRCFRIVECQSFGPPLVEMLSKLGVRAELVDLSDTYENSRTIRQNHFEIWFSKL